ncbi:hypothetical protein EDB82DRAFT_471112 [Fusarium venenatum]|uniref:uncharacterized protein n=1 Tax=Fusarium venenatum TaxID=56646 RepID=UPI001DCF9071|nr:hypothetical protein EDB82DRAFT_471112 [Fusarium venenatum]
MDNSRPPGELEAKRQSECFNRYLNRMVKGRWTYMCFLQHRPPESRVYGTERTVLDCKSPICSRTFDSSQYCVSIRPPMFGSSTILPNYYHVPCFAQLANLTYLPHLHRLWPLNRFTWRRADIAINSPEDSSYRTKDRFLDVGAEHLLQELKWRYYSRCIIKAGVTEAAQLIQAGNMDTANTTIPAVSNEEQQLLTAPIDVSRERNLFDIYLPNIGLADTITKSDIDFSKILTHWEYTSSRYRFEENDDVREALEGLGCQPNSSNFYDEYVDWTAVNGAYNPEEPLPVEMVEWSKRFSNYVDEPVRLAFSSANGEESEDNDDTMDDEGSEDVMDSVESEHSGESEHSEYVQDDEDSDESEM